MPRAGRGDWGLRAVMFYEKLWMLPCPQASGPRWPAPVPRPCGTEPYPCPINLDQPLRGSALSQGRPQILHRCGGPWAGADVSGASQAQSRETAYYSQAGSTWSQAGRGGTISRICFVTDLPGTGSHPEACLQLPWREPAVLGQRRHSIPSASPPQSLL